VFFGCFDLHIHTHSHTFTHIHTHSHTFTHIHTHSHTFTHIHSHFSHILPLIILLWSVSLHLLMIPVYDGGPNVSHFIFTFIFHFHFSLSFFTFIFHFHFSLSFFTFIFHFHLNIYMNSRSNIFSLILRFLRSKIFTKPF
jgi:hypothetical protein